MKIIYCNLHFDKCHNIFEWIKKLPISIDFYVCFDKDFYCDPINSDAIHEDFPIGLKTLNSLSDIIDILDEETLVLGYPCHFDTIDSKAKINYKKGISLSGNYPPPENVYFLTHSRNFLYKYNVNNLGLYIPKIYNISYNSVSYDKRKNYYSYIRFYEKLWGGSYKQFGELHNKVKNYGITLVNYGFQQDRLSCEYDVSQKIFCPISKATVHIKTSDNVSNSVCKSIYYETPVLMLKADVNNNWFDSINGIYTFENINDMAEFMLKMETDSMFYKQVIEDTKLAKHNNNLLTDEVIHNSMVWIKNVFNYE